MDSECGVVSSADALAERDFLGGIVSIIVLRRRILMLIVLFLLGAQALRRCIHVFRLFR